MFVTCNSSTGWSPTCQIDFADTAWTASLCQSQGSGAAEEPDVLLETDGEVDADVRGALLVCGCDVEATGVVCGGDVERLPAALAGLLSLDVTVLTVSASRTISTATEPIRTRRRRQYTDGGCDPTG